MENNITFTSIIRPVKKSVFDKAAGHISSKNFVDYPWTCSQSVRGQESYTTGVLDCTMCGITDGQDVFMMHICPTKEENSNFSKIKDFMLNKIDFKNKDLSAFVIGAKDYPDDKTSYRLFDNFIKFLKSKGVPTTSIRGGDVYEPVDVLYRSQNDEWLIASRYLDRFVGKEPPEKVLNHIFPEIKLIEDDIITD